MSIALVLLGEAPEDFAWEAGPWTATPPRASAISAAVEPWLTGSEAPELLAFWDVRLGQPDAARLRRVAALPGDVWHGGLELGQAGLPRLLECVHPTWMLGLDPPTGHVATSWRLSLRALLVRSEVWRGLGGPDGGYFTLGGAALELGHRWLWGGALTRYVPELLPANGELEEALPVADEVRFLAQRTGRFWTAWALARGLLARRLGLAGLTAAWRLRALGRTGGEHLPRRETVPSTTSKATSKARAVSAADEDRKPPRVSVLIPTLDRYPYLDVVLEQLAGQTALPHEVIVVDQTAPGRRRDGESWRHWHERSPWPLRVLERDAPGQSSARNAGLAASTGEVILFLDDDVEIDEDLVAGHLEALERRRADACCGVADEVGAGALPAEFQEPRVSDVFPTCNASLRRRALEGSGLFDLAFDHGARADADLGTRLYLSGALMVLEPSLSVLHHRAPAGGLRQHRARVVTYASSRRSLARHLPSVTELYLARRYASPRAVREMVWQRALGTLRARGPLGRRIAKLLWGLLLLPATVLEIRARSRRADALLERYPQIPKLEERSDDSLHESLDEELS